MRKDPYRAPRSRHDPVAGGNQPAGGFRGGPDDVAALAQDLAAPPSIRSWILDIASPGLLRMLMKRMAAQLQQAAPFKFAPAEGPDFFLRYGWKPADVRSLLKNAARLKRLPFFLRLIALLPESESSRRNRPWSGICLLSKSE